MYLQRSNVYNKDVEAVQNMLNTALLQNLYRGKWQKIKVDGYYGPETEKAVRAFQYSHNPRIDQTGIVGDTTYNALKQVGPFLSAASPQCYISAAPSPIMKAAPSGTVTNPALEFVNAIVMGWNNMSTPLSQMLFVVGEGFIVFLEKNNNLTLHANLKQIAKEILLPQHTRHGQWFRINNKSFYRHGFQSFSISKSIAKVSNLIEIQSRNLGVLGLVIETMDIGGKIFKGELKFMDGTKYAFDSISVGLDVALSNVKTISLPLKQVATNYGKTIAKWKFATKIAGKVSAGTVAGTTIAAGTTVVFIQCVGAFMTGWELGTWIEKKTHIGETAVDFYWELFVGDMVEKFYEWKTNRIVCVRYPEDWTESQIKEFQAKFK